MTRQLLALLVATALLGGPALAAEKEDGGGPLESLRRANEQATEATRGTAKDVGRAAGRANEEATRATRGTAREVGEALQDAADDLGKAFRDLGKKLTE
jgi:hypothetical protein